MAYIPATRNFDNVQFADLRKVVDPEFNDLHDELSAAYYNKTPFRTYGVLDKITFDKLHDLVFLKRDEKFHEENIKKADGEKIDEKKYNEIIDEEGKTVKKDALVKAKIAAYAAEGIIL